MRNPNSADASSELEMELVATASLPTLKSFISSRESHANHLLPEPPNAVRNRQSDHHHVHAQPKKQVM